MSCCANQSPRINERNGRIFCGSCRAYLDGRPQTTPEPLRDEAAPKSGIAPADTIEAGEDVSLEKETQA